MNKKLVHNNQNTQQVDSLQLMSRFVIDRNHNITHDNNQPISLQNIGQEYNYKSQSSVSSSCYDNNQLDMSVLIMQGLEIARRKTQRQYQFSGIIQLITKNSKIIENQIKQQLAYTQIQILQQQQAAIMDKIRDIQNYVNRLKNQQKDKKTNNTLIGYNNRRYYSPIMLFGDKCKSNFKRNKKIQNLNSQIKNKKQEFLRNKIRLEQLKWEEDKIERKSRIQNVSKYRYPSRTLSKNRRFKNNSQSQGKPKIWKQKPVIKISARKSSKNSQSNTPKKQSKINEKSNVQKQYYCQDKSDLIGQNSIHTHQQSRKQFLLRRSRIVKESIALFQGTFAKMFSQLQLQCKILLKELQCLDDQINNTNVSVASLISASNCIQNYPQNCLTVINNTESNRLENCKSEQRLNPSDLRYRVSKISPISHGNSQNLRNIVRGNERKISFYQQNSRNSRQSMATCKKIRISSAYEIDSQGNKSVSSNKVHRKGQNIATETVKQIQNKKQNLILQEYFQTNDTDDKHNNNVKVKYIHSPEYKQRRYY